jgi:hypothetical protein
VDEFSQPNRGKSGVLIACRTDYLLDQLLDCISSTLGSG